MRHTTWLGIALTGFVGCGSGTADDTPPPAAAPPPASSAPAAGSPGASVAAKSGSGSIAVTVKWAGEAPKRRAVQMSERVCAEHAQNSPVLDETVIVNGNQTLRNVFVWIKKGIKGKYEPPSEPVAMTQKWCVYRPHVVGVQAGQTLRVSNDDGVLHNVHTFAKRNDNNVNLGQPPNTADEITFNEREVVVPFKCDVHGWMSAYVAVVPHPFFGVTNESGVVTLERLPAGTYTIEAWHELYGTQTQEITVGDGAATEVRFEFRDQ